MRDFLAGILVETFPAVVTVPTGCIVPASDAYPSGHPPGQLVEVQIEATLSSMVVAVAGCKEKTEKRMLGINCLFIGLAAQKRLQPVGRFLLRRSSPRADGGTF